jgi:hypothetical protein
MIVISGPLNYCLTQIDNKTRTHNIIYFADLGVPAHSTCIHYIFILRRKGFFSRVVSQII